MHMNPTSAIILAGGEGKRVGGRDKGLIPWHGKPMVEHIIEALEPQVQETLISCNRNKTIYAQYRLPIIEDSNDGFLGPLIGLFSAHTHCKFDYVVTVPCDCPTLPTDLVARLHESLADYDMTVVRDSVGIQPLFLLSRKPCIASIESYLADGNRSVKGWLSGHRWTTADFSEYKDGFLNLNQ